MPHDGQPEPASLPSSEPLSCMAALVWNQAAIVHSFTRLGRGVVKPACPPSRWDGEEGVEGVDADSRAMNPMSATPSGTTTVRRPCRIRVTPLLLSSAPLPLAAMSCSAGTSCRGSR